MVKFLLGVLTTAVIGLVALLVAGGLPAMPAAQNAVMAAPLVKPADQLIAPYPTPATAAPIVTSGDVGPTDEPARIVAITEPFANGGIISINQNGRLYTLTPHALIDCVNAQANGRRTGPTCPSNAQQYAGMVGGGR